MEHDTWVKLVFDVDPASFDSDPSEPEPAKADAKPAAGADKAKKVKDTADTVNGATDDKLSKLSSADKVKLVKALFANGKPTGDARKAQIKIYKNMDLDPAFKKREEERGDRIAKNLSGDKDLKDARDHWDKKDKAAKLAALKKIIAAQSKEYGFDPPEIETYDEPAHKEADGNTYVTNGHFEASDGKLHLNTSADSNFSDFEAIVTTALHENGHNYQARLVKDFRAGKIKEGDPDYAQAAMFDVNDDGDAYIQPGEDFEAYRRQPEENHSRTMGPDIASKINLALQKSH